MDVFTEQATLPDISRMEIFSSLVAPTIRSSRGHRIELGEIETALEECQDRQAVVVVREEREGDKRLVAYLVADDSETSATHSLRSSLESKLPSDIPRSLQLCLPSFDATTDNGKINRKALLELPPPNPSAGTAAEPASEFANELERLIAKAWQEALGLPAIGIDDNFFDLGAHSLTIAGACQITGGLES